MEAPDVNLDSDEDSADEDSGGLIDLTGRQLRAPAEAVLASGDRIGGEIEECHTEEITKRRKSSKEQRVRQWKKDDIVEKELLFPMPDVSEYRNMSCYQVTELFLDCEVISFLVDQLTKYALQKNMPDPKVTTEEMKCFLGILVLSGYNNLPGKKCYWDSSEDMRNHMVYNAMRRDRFIQILRFIHCADNTALYQKDKMGKLRPLMNMMKKRFMKHFKPTQELNYDESMIEYYGRHGCEQCIRGKPISFGYKVWCLNTKSGYLLNFEVYQGAIPNANIQYEELYGKAVAPMLQMIDSFPEEMKPLPFRFYFDNLFTGIPLLSHFKYLGYGGTGTV